MPHDNHRAPVFHDATVVNIDPEIHSGAPVFVGTRVPIHTFLEYIEGGYRPDEFLDHIPSVRREQTTAFLQQSADALLRNMSASPPAR